MFKNWCPSNHCS